MNDAPSHRECLAPPASLGILGAGQLGRMLVQAAQKMGYRTVVLDPDPNAPAAHLSEEFLQFAYDDRQGMDLLAQRASRVTTEFENVPAATLDHLSQTIAVHPSAFAVGVAQDRIVEKNMIRSCQLQTAPFHVIRHPTDIFNTPLDLFPGILKTARLGYDGKGQLTVNDLEELHLAYASLNASSKAPHASEPISCILEKKLPLQAEYSVIVARNERNDMVHLPIQCNQHVKGILHLSSVFEHALGFELETALINATRTLAQELSYVGVLCVEFFVLADPRASHPNASKSNLPTWLVNEIAPRPHNSGHHSLDSCDVSQFELQVRALCGLALVQPRQHSPCVMLNLLGDLWFKKGTDPLEPPWEKVLALSGTHLHLYGKTQARKGRKMGHLNITAAHPIEVLSTLEQCLHLLELPPLSRDFLTMSLPP